MKWTTEKLRTEALKYNRMNEFNKNNHAAYRAAHRRGVFYEICSHMSQGRVPWDSATVKSEAMKYNSRTVFRLKSAGAYLHALKEGSLDAVCSHME